jgi:hypothetical protein
MKNLVWIASYPKSGNTWLRSIIFAALTGRVELNELRAVVPGFNALQMAKPASKSSNTLKTHVEYRDQAQEIASRRADNKFQFFKTHSAAIEINGSNFPNISCTAKAVYIVRDPRDVAVSYARHYGKDINDTIQSMLDTHNTSHGDKQIEFLSSWKMHVMSWQKKKFPVLLIRYEDLLENTELEIRRLLNFLALTPKISVAELVQATSFAKLKSKETKVGFTEAVDKKTFFWQGKSGHGKFFLGADFTKMETEFADVMGQLGYR